MPLYVLCPFFKYEKKKVFGCEAGVVRFPSYKHKKGFGMRFCCSWDFEQCQRYQRLMKEYEVKGNGIQEKQNKNTFKIG